MCERGKERGGKKQSEITQKEIEKARGGGGGRRETDNRQKVGEIWRLQAAPDSVWKSNIHYVCSSGAGSQSAVGDLSQSAEKPRALPEA